MDAITDPEIEEVVLMSPAQWGKTEVILNTIGYFIDQEPSPIFVIIATLDLARSFSKDRLSTMLRDTPALQGKVKDAKTRSGDNTILHKTFTGGHITMAGANSPASLASRPIRIVLLDEVSLYPTGAVELAKKRATTYWNRKYLLTSTPGIKGICNIERAYLQSDMRKYFVPCPKCKFPQILKWSQLKWEKKNGIHRPETAYYECSNCRSKLFDRNKPVMLRDGEWIAEHPDRKIAGFWANQLYSPWVSFEATTREFLDKRGDPLTFRTFVNEVWAETWEEGSSKIDDTALSARRTNFGDTIPRDVLFLTISVDVQVDRLEIELVGWGVQEESWGVEYKVLSGNPSHPYVWQDLEDYITQTFTHQNGYPMIASGIAIDSGYKTDDVYSFVLPRIARRVHGKAQRIIAIKGAKDAQAPIIPARSSRVGPQKRVPLWNIGVNQAKDLLNHRLQIVEPGPGYMHFSNAYDDRYFSQFKNEYVKIEKGIRRWVPVRHGLPVEAIDIKNYGLAALRICIFKTLKPDWDKYVINQQRQSISKPRQRVISTGIDKSKYGG